MNQLVKCDYQMTLHNGDKIKLNIDEQRYQKLLNALVEDKSKFIRINDGVVATSAIAYIVRR
ncbi:MAG TPA: hypothetical protein PLV82_02630 [bacterium]|mgnify:CR=1 FL=1|nr:hypothetical protein [bacterium]